MLKAAAWRLARLLRLRPAAIQSMQPAELWELIEARYAGKKRQGEQRGNGLRLLKKMERLRSAPA
jgi:hypothetical protein